MRTELDGLRREELVPFRAAIAAGVKAIMTAHIRVPALDDLPATISRAHLTALLREELGFDGVVMTDALEMRAISATVGVENGAVLALAAGADALCLGHDLEEDAVRSVRAAIVAAVRAGELSGATSRRGGGPGARRRRLVAGARGERPAPDLQPSASRRLAARSRRWGRHGCTGHAFVLECVPQTTMAADPLRRGLGDLVRERDPLTAAVRLAEGVHDAAALVAGAGGRRVVLVVRDPQRHDWERSLRDAVLHLRPDTVVVDVGYPDPQPPAAAGTITTYGAGLANLTAAAELLVVSAPAAPSRSAGARPRARPRPRRAPPRSHPAWPTRASPSR